MILDVLTEGLTFDDVLLEPARSEVLPTEVDTRTCLTRQIGLNIPIVSAVMDTVTESHLAIALAQQGGIGIVHRNMPIDRQAEEVDRVKRSESGMILDPVKLEEGATVGDALRLMAENKIGGIPVVSPAGKLVGIVFAGIDVAGHPTAAQDRGAIAERLDIFQLVRDEQDGHAAVPQPAQCFEEHFHRLRRQHRGGLI